MDLTPCSESVNVELVIVGPNDDELCSILLVQHQEWVLDKIMHLRQDAEPGWHRLHVGVFRQDQLVARATKRFKFPLSESE